MKYYRILFLAAALTGLASCAVDPLKEYETEKPQSIAQYEYLNDYDVLKNYVNRSASPDFKLGAALAASDFQAHGQVYALAVSNFDEMTAGNDMKYSSIVANDGSMSFDGVRNFVNAAADAGMTVYGHTLAWHSQQNNKYLNSLIKDKELEIDPDAKAEVEVTSITYTDGPFPFYAMGCEPPVVNGAIHFVPTGDWSQFFIMPGANNKLTEGDYVAYLEMTSDKDVASGVQLTIQNGWGGSDQNVTVPVTVVAGDNVYRLNVPGLVGGNYDVILKPQTADAVLDVKSIKFSRLEAPAVEVEKEVNTISYTDGPFPFYAMGCEPPVVGGYMHYEPNGSWNQFFIMPGANNPLTEGDHVVYLTMKANVDMASGVQLTMQNGWGGTDQSVTVGVSVKAGEHEYRLSFPGLLGGNYDAILKPQTAEVTLDVKGVRVCKVEKLNSIPLTPEEKKDTLTWAMDNWIKGMMEVTAQKVSAWDVVNEPISDKDADGDGYYDLQSAANGDASANFYWSDYLGAEDYVRLVVEKARKYYAEFEGTAPLKLFINDFNLESDWDNNKKLASLIHWIGVWESDGKTKIDGIATQMHVSYYEDAKTQASKEAAVVKMFKDMAATGKLVKVSELDMGYVDASGAKVPTANMTDAQHQAMAGFYAFIVKAYLDNVPADQQYGITQWCITDSAADSGWRAGEATGLWDANFNRKHAYAGFAAGLGGTPSAE